MCSVVLYFTHAGIVAGVWPCGIITFLGEIFGSESKSQVYGLLHAFLHCNADTTSEFYFLYHCICTHVYKSGFVLYIITLRNANITLLQITSVLMMDAISKGMRPTALERD